MKSICTVCIHLLNGFRGILIITHLSKVFPIYNFTSPDIEAAKIRPYSTESLQSQGGLVLVRYTTFI